MKKQVIFFFFVFCVSYQGIALTLTSSDSVGVSTKEGVKYVIHEVEAGETLFGLSRKYRIDVQSIKNANSNSINNLSIGQKVLIPFPKVIERENAKIHIVKSSETLFSISRLYNVKVDELKNWNDLNENSISVGQKLIIRNTSASSGSSITQHTELNNRDYKTHVVEQSQTLYSISRMYGISTDQLIEWNNLGSNALKIGQVLIVSTSSVGTEKKDLSNSSMLPANQNAIESPQNTESAIIEKPIETAAIGAVVATTDIDETTISETAKPAEKVVQKGMAEVIDGTSETKKYLAMHRDAPVGTIMQVKNEMNNQNVFVRIVGTIQPTGDNSKVILKISQKAYDRLGAVDSRFPVELSYIP